MKNIWKWVVGLLCLGCCAVPVWLIISGGAFSLSLFTKRIEVIVCAAIIFAVVAFVYIQKRKVRHSNTCPIDCECGKNDK